MGVNSEDWPWRKKGSFIIETKIGGFKGPYSALAIFDANEIIDIAR